MIEQSSAGKEPDLQKVLCVTERELKKLYRGRLLLSGTDCVQAAEVCEMTPEELINATLQQGADQNEGREFVLDLIDVYIDAKEALARVS